MSTSPSRSVRPRCSGTGWPGAPPGCRPASAEYAAGAPHAAQGPGVDCVSSWLSTATHTACISCTQYTHTTHNYKQAYYRVNVARSPFGDRTYNGGQVV